MSYGVIRFMAAKSFHAIGGGLKGEAFQEWVTGLVTSAGGAKPQSTHDWAKISEAIRREGMFILEASAPAFGVMLRFSVDTPADGDYTILHRPRGNIERGRTTEVAQVTQESSDIRVSMLNPFKTRFIVTTVNAERPHDALVWHV